MIPSRHIACALALTAATPAHAQAPAAAPAGSADAPVTIPGAVTWTMHAADGRAYQIFLARPDGPPPPGGYPVVYAVDGNARFATLAEAVRSQARIDPAQRAIVVGIGYPAGTDPMRERIRDLTFPSPGGRPTPPGGGGADAFLDFIATRLKPEIARRLPVDPAREMLFGHSFGGLFVGYALMTRPELFDLWSSASPSVWYGDRWLLGEATQRAFAARVARMAVKPSVLITVGTYEQAPDPDFPDPRAAELATLRQVDGARDFAAALRRVPGVTARFEPIERENHGSVVPAATSRTVRMLFAPDRPSTP